MSLLKNKLRLALAGWEPGRVHSGFGAKVGGLGTVLEELPEELIAVADGEGFDLQIELLTPCFAPYDRSKLERLSLSVPVRLEDHLFEFEVYRQEVSLRLSLIYFWDEGQLGWTTAEALYPEDPEMAFKLFATVSQAMAGYIVAEGNFDTVHGHDYHVGLIPFYLGDGFLRRVPFHFTIHNASYQGIYPVGGSGFEKLDRINLPGRELFHRYFDFFDNLNFTKAAMLKSYESGGKITTVSGDWEASWGYAAELKETAEALKKRAAGLKQGRPPLEVFLPNRHLDLFEKLPILGITNGMSSSNHPESLPELQAGRLREIQRKRGEKPIFRHPQVQQEMLAKDHHFSPGNLDGKSELKRLLNLELFSEEDEESIILVAVGRLVEQKHFDLIAEIIEPALEVDPHLRFALLASSSQADRQGREVERRFRELAGRYPRRIFFEGHFNGALSRLMIAGADFSLIPSRFEPCGLVDYEASLLGTVVIGHRTGGLAKVGHCAYLYDWLDMGDPGGEAEAFLSEIRRAIRTYRDHPEAHRKLVEDALRIEAGWGPSARQYLMIYRYGLLQTKWQRERERLLSGVDEFARRVLEEQPEFSRLYTPVPGDSLNDRLVAAIGELRREGEVRSGPGERKCGGH